MTEAQAGSSTPFLRAILSSTRERVAALTSRRAAILRAAHAAPEPPPWRPALVRGDVAVIAEIKRRSPSAGAIAPGLDPAELAAAYAAGGARALSVLTEEAHFGGSLDDLVAAGRGASLPRLRKDFIVDALQIAEARAAGASAVLLIVRVLDQAALRTLAAQARDLGLATLVEAHGPEELDRALAVAPDGIGVNCRDLDTFVVRPEAAEPVLRAVPAGVVAVAESGIRTRDDVERVAGWGADAILVGTAVAGAADPRGAVARLVGVARQPRSA